MLDVILESNSHTKSLMGRVWCRWLHLLFFLSMRHIIHQRLTDCPPLYNLNSIIETTLMMWGFHCSGFNIYTTAKLSGHSLLCQGEDTAWVMLVLYCLCIYIYISIDWLFFVLFVCLVFDWCLFVCLLVCFCFCFLGGLFGFFSLPYTFLCKQ